MISINAIYFLYVGDWISLLLRPKECTHCKLPLVLEVPCDRQPILCKQAI
ncbi:hypothetical protein Syun_019325 [Stephania yunnanensis]|uniref:Uncharacterized protein n=1 Tax=Stephania yunnanensis TaxID=152371 RepID=A0AAP0ITX9_9MAGN